MSRDGKQIFVQGHPEYDRMTLNNEYHRDLNKGLNPSLPVNYYVYNDPFSVPELTWRNTPASSDSARMTSSGCFSISSLRTSV